MAARLIIRSAGATDKGRRQTNEDAFLVDNGLRLFVVADGMGGANAGDVASGLTVDTMAQSMTGSAMEPDKDPSLSWEAQRLKAGVLAANNAVFQSSQNNAARKGMGSTVAAVLVTDATIIAANVGDSPIYRFRGDVIEPLWVPHTLQELCKEDEERARELTEQERHMLTRALGVGGHVEVEIFETPVFTKDCLLLCSDGVSDVVSPEEMRDAALSRKPEKACADLMALALDRGGRDNVTVVIVRCKKRNSWWMAPFTMVLRLFGR
ncbi:MAG: serine/threonine-protein phosphatase [Desulfovibrio sp.]|nr:MAG: serine/threonine-protein phosphatase [Desulfovibrio sp.]